ncbi:MAG: Zn-ribbon domain-containing OB-fold protein [Chloroflexota bacterium]
MTSTPGGRPDFPLPVPNEDGAPFWEHLRAGELRIQHCTSCGRLQHPPRVLCPGCGSPDRDWAPMSGRGTVYSFVVTHQAIHPSFEGHLPYVTALVELEEGPRLATNLIDIPPGEVEIGMPVEVELVPVSDEITLPLFRRPSSLRVE